MEHTASSCHWKLPMLEMSMVEAKFHTVLPVTGNNRVSNFTDVHNHVHCNTNSGAEPNHEHFKWSEDAASEAGSSQSDTMEDKSSDRDRKDVSFLASGSKLLSEIHNDTSLKLPAYWLHVCLVCDQIFESLARISAHQITHEQQLRFTTKSHACGCCGKSFDQRSQLQEHFAVHSSRIFIDNDPSKAYKCPDCPQFCKSINEFKIHFARHTSGKLFKCDLCELTFSCVKSLELHKKIHKKTCTERNCDNVQQCIQHECSICGKCYSTDKRLHQHLTLGHNLTKKCDICGRSFDSCDILASHKLVHTQEDLLLQHQCNVCDKKFRFETDLQKHIQSQPNHKDVCEICYKWFSTRAFLHIHKRDHNHGALPPNYEARDRLGRCVCSNCGKCFQSAFHLRSHIDCQHIGELCYVCDLCGKKFTNYATLHRHRKTHLTRGEDIEPLAVTYSTENNLKQRPLTDCQASNDSVMPSLGPLSEPLLGSDMIMEISPKSEKFGDIGVDLAENHPKLNSTMKHKKEHEPGRVPKMPQASYSYRRAVCSSTFALHSRVRGRHVGELCHVCEFCLRKFTNVGALQHHRRGHIKNRKLKSNTLQQPKNCQVITSMYGVSKITASNDMIADCNLKSLTVDEHSTLLSQPNTGLISCGPDLVSTSDQNSCNDFSISCQENSSTETVDDAALMTSQVTMMISDMKYYKCPDCTKSFKFLHNFRSHVVTHQNDQYTDDRLGMLATGNQSICEPSSRELNKVERSCIKACDTCGKFFASNDILAAHKLVHIQASHHCRICDEQYSSEAELMEHIQNKHEHENVCAVCYKWFKTEQFLQDHKKEHVLGWLPTEYLAYDTDGFLFCNVCGHHFSKSTSTVYAQSHVQCRHIGELCFSCEFCSRKFTNTASLRRHREIHAKQSILECHMKKIRTTVPDRVNHLRQEPIATLTENENELSERLACEVVTDVAKSTHDDVIVGLNEPNVITSCSDSNGSQGTSFTQDHVAEVSCPATMASKYYKHYLCPYCMKSFKYLLFFQRHLILHGDSSLCCDMDNNFDKPSVHSQIQFRALLNIDGSWTCNICGKLLNSKTGCQLHKAKHKQPVPSKESRRYGYIGNSCLCALCGKNFRSNYLLRHHEWQAHGEGLGLMCEVCGETFPNAKRLYLHQQRHRMIKHIGSSSDFGLPCSVCGKLFTTSSSLKGHMIVHQTERPFPCHLCSLRFKIPMQLKAHIKSVHMPKSGLKPFVCHYYGCRAFGTAGELRTHLRIHTGEKPFKCASCDKAFITKSALKDHIAVMHSDVKSFACHVCGRQFALRKDMNRHIKDRHRTL